jgi:hypothetical protein
MGIDNVNDLSPRIQYTALAAQTAFDYPFPIFADADLTVDVDGVAQTLTTDYTVSGATDDTGGTVTFVTAPGAGAIVTIHRDSAIARTSDFGQNGPFLSTAVNDELDQLFLIAQELENKIGRTVRFPQTAGITNAQAELNPLSSFTGKFLRVTSAGLLEGAAITDEAEAISAELIGGLLYPRTANEIAAGITPTNYQYSPGNVKRYGALGDGVATDTTSLQEALDSGHNVWIPDGTYITDELTVSSNTFIEFESHAAVLKLRTGAAAGDNILTNSDPTGGNSDITIISGKTDGNRVARAAVSAAGGTQSDNNISMTKVTRLSIRGHYTTSATRHGVNTSGNGTPVDENDYLTGNISSHVLIEGCLATDCGDDGITLHHTDYGIIRGNICWDMAATLASNSNGIEIEDGCRHVIIADNICYNTSEYDATAAAARVRSDAAGSFMRRGIDVEASAGLPSPQNIQIVNNNVRRVWKGIDARRDGDTALGTPKNLVIANNKVSDCQSTLIRVISYVGYVIDGNICEGEQSNALSTSDGILVDDDAGDGVISNNYVANLPTLDRGIAVRTGAGDYHVIDGNRVNDAGADSGIRVDVVNDVTITDNYVTAVSGATGGIRCEDAVRPFVTGNKIDGSPTQIIFNPSQDGTDPVYKDNYPDTEPQTGTDFANLAVLRQVLDSSGGAVSSTLGNGRFIGQRMIYTMSDASNASTVSVNNHETSSPEVFTFNATTDLLILEWSGSVWFTVKNIGVTT